MNCMQFNETDQQVKLEFKDVSYFSSGEGGNVSAAIAEHNSATDAHSDIRLLIQGLSERLSALADSDDTTLDQLSEIVAYIKSNRDLISAITTNKVSVSDIVDNLTTNVANKPLSAAQGVALKALIDAITVPTALSDLTDDATHRVVTDEEKAVWNAKSNFTGSYNDLTDKPTIPAPYTLPIASETTLGGVKPVAKTDEMTQPVGVDEAGALYTKAGSGGGGGGDSAFELIDTIDWSTEEMAAASSGMEYTLSGVTDVLILWSGMVNSTSTVSSLNIDFNALSLDSMFTGALPTGKSGTPLYGYTLFKLLPGVGYTYIGSGGAIASTNYSKSNPNFPYNIFPDTSEKITKIRINNPPTQYYAVGGITKIYVR